MKKYTYIKSLVLLLLCQFSVDTVVAQGTLSGQVKDELGMTLPGVSVVIKGDFEGVKGAVTDFDGNFNIPIPEGAKTITFSFVGYKNQTFEIGTRTVFDITLPEDVETLEDVVVIGYATVKKSDVTGSMSALTAKDFNAGVMTNANEMMQGRASGVQIAKSSGAPGASSNIRIRGISSISRGRGPLYVVDGIPIQGAVGAQTTSGIDAGGTDNLDPLNYINPADIVSIDVLKDASATAIYGSRGAAGVIIITTKKGQSGQSTLEFSTYTSVSQVRKQIDVLTASDWVKARQILAKQTGDLSYLEDDFGGNTNWQDEIFRRAYTRNYSVSASGGNETSNYMFSLSHMNQEGVVINSGLKRFTGRLNVSQKVLEDRLKLEANLTAANTQNRWAPVGNGGAAGGDLIGNALRTNPTIPVYDNDGEYFQPRTTIYNPVAMANLIDDQSTNDSFLGGASADLKIIDGLNNKTSIGVEVSNTERNTNSSQLLLPIESQEGIASIANNRSMNVLLENFTTYSFKIGEQEISTMAGFAFQRQPSEFNTIYARGYDSNQILYTDNVGLSDPEIVRNVGSGKRVYEMQSFFGRLQYSIFGRYRLTASLRADGSSRFGDNNKYGLFPSAALAWTISDEQFLLNQNLLSNLNLRIGYGHTGNDNVPDYQYLDLVRFNADGGIERTQFANPDLKWETTVMTNIGLDFGFLSDRISGTVDIYDKRTSDMLLLLEQPAPAFVPQKWVNSDAVLINRGIELNLTTNWLKTTAFSWSTTGVFTRVNTTIEDLPVPIIGGALNGQGLVGSFVQQIDNGDNLWNYVLREHQGFDENGFSIYQNGENAENVMSQTSPYEDYGIGLTNSVSYKGFDLNFFMEAKVGKYVYNNTANTYLNRGALAQGNNTSLTELTRARSISDVPLASTYYLEDASFIRLTNITLGYNVPVEKLPYVSGVRVYVTGQNLWVGTKYSGFDPDVNSSASGEGIDYTSYPNPSAVMAGLNVKF